MIKIYNIYLFKNEELEKEYKEIKTIDKDGKIIFTTIYITIYIYNLYNYLFTLY